ncbi:MAG: PAS domain S-box protein [Candidatus Latescibacteria bacterium]|nr:PAS domain S-box protein [Candidatus Latescibacterota bacterium]
MPKSSCRISSIVTFLMTLGLALAFIGLTGEWTSGMGLVVKILLSLLVSGLAAALLYSFMRTPIVVNEEVTTRTQKLAASNQVLKSEISDWERAEVALQESEARFRSLFQATFEGILIHDQGRILHANETAAAMVGYEVQDVIGMNVVELVTSESQELLKQIFQELAEDPRAKRDAFELVVKRRDGSTYHAEILGKPFTWEGKDVRVAAFRDITERRQAQLTLEQANEVLEHKVDERTTELMEQRAHLVQSEKMAALGQLVAGVAHEINTPLGAMKSNNDVFIRTVDKLRTIVEAEDMPQEIREHSQMHRIFDSVEKLNHINRDAVERIVTIVGSLRKFARLDQAEVDDVDIHEGIDSTLTLVHHQLKNRIEVNRNFGALPLVSCHPGQINQVLMNILVNASQAIEGNGEITIATSTMGENSVRIDISDTGKGIDKDQLARIFDPGFTTKGSGVGTGLGLSIVHQIIDEHGGSIEVESEPGEGSTFSIILPVQNDAT